MPTEEQKAYRRRYYREHTEEERVCKHRYYLEHKREKEERDRRFDSAHPGARARYCKKSRDALKVAVLTQYGSGKLACVKCGFSDVRALSIDHIDGGGKQHREEIRRGSLYRWLARNDFPEGYQTLCMNCQWIKRMENKEYGGARCQ